MKYPEILLYVGCWLVWINLATFGAFKWDKQRSRNGEWRIPESTLLSLAFWGGSAGAIMAQQILRHKTRKQPFRSYLLAFFALHLSLMLVFAIPVTREFVTDLYRTFADRRLL